MKRLLFIPIVLLTILVMSSLSCSFASETIRQTRDVSSFTEIQLSIHAMLFLTQGDNQEIIIEAEEDDLQIIETEVSNGKLNIKCSERKNKLNGYPKVFITIPEIDGVIISGSGKVIAEEKIVSDNIYTKISGSGNIKFADLTATSIIVHISGSGNIDIGGNNPTGDVDIKISGSGNISMETIKAEKADIHISGSGNCKVNVSEELDAKISGSGDVFYLGKPAINASVSGSGKIKRL
jgi:hypothetical protein